MRRLPLIVLLLTSVTACQPVVSELTDDQKAPIAAEIAARHAEAAEAIRAKDVDAWLSYFENSDELTFTSCTR